MRDTAEVYELLQDPHFAVPAAILLLSLAALALILYLQEREDVPKPANGEKPKEVVNAGGTVFVEDEEGHTVRRSKRERKSVARFAPDNNYQGQFVDPTTPHGKAAQRRSTRAKPEI
eukprot:jgi/Ulvmu1/9591/UM054_0021.1